jgi:hypothetical protein
MTAVIKRMTGMVWRSNTLMALKPQAAMPTCNTMTSAAIMYLISGPPLNPIRSSAAMQRSSTIQVLIATHPIGISTCASAGR